MNSNHQKRGGLTFVPPGHDGVTQGQGPEELCAVWTRLLSQLLHQLGGGHEEAAAREGIPAQVHGLLTHGEEGQIYSGGDGRQPKGEKIHLERRNYLRVFYRH